MGSGVLKTLPSYKVSKDQFLDFFSHSSHSVEPRIGLLLRRLSVCLGSDDFVSVDASIVDYCLASLARTWDPISVVALAVVVLVPHMLWTVVTEMSFFVACVTLNFV